MFSNALVVVNISSSAEGNEDHNLKGLEELKKRVSERKEKHLVNGWEKVKW